jgi:hypothetical protein
LYALLIGSVISLMPEVFGSLDVKTWLETTAVLSPLSLLGLGLRNFASAVQNIGPIIYFRNGKMASMKVVSKGMRRNEIYGLDKTCEILVTTGATQEH